ncbi:hypothetical protein BGZ54_003474 [Gamsiella multidivaricata]|nr:hypothetical protein BGZ54_003474 [Gamsiella multidivaricata]
MESSGLRSDATPRMLKRPRNVVQLVAGRQVVLAKDANGQIWQWCRENKAVEVTFGTDRYTDARGGHSINSVKRDPIVQISAGWEICAALTRSGRVFAWQPPQSADGRYQHRIHVKHSVSLSEQGPRGYKAATVDGDKFVQIAAGTDYIVAVTLLEKVYVFRRLDSPNYSDPNDLSQQQQSPHFPPWQTTLHQQQDESTDRIVIETMVEGSMQERILEVRGKILGEGLYLPVFSEALTQTITATYEEHDQWERRLRHQQRTHHPGSTCDLKSGLHCTASRLTTISAYSKNFALHRSSGKVLLGKDDVQADTRPVVLERFYSDVSQMAFGDHHQGLLTEDGLLRTWGSFSHGALGQGDLRLGCEIPTVVEGPLKNKILIGIGMAGWQSVCLAIDMSEDKVYHAHYDQSFLRTQTIYKGKKAFVDDGYHSPENINGSSVSGSGSRSSSEGFDSSDGEEWTLPGKDSESSWSNDPIYVSRNSPGLTLAGGSAPTSTSWTHSSALYRPLSASCTATCSLLVNPYSHRLGNGSTHSRPTFLRKRSSSMTERHPESSSRRAQEASHGHRGYCYYGGAKEENRASMLALTRLSPIMAVYEPTSATEVDVITRRFSVL